MSALIGCWYPAPQGDGKSWAILEATSIVKLWNGDTTTAGRTIASGLTESEALRRCNEHNEVWNRTLAWGRA